MKKKNLQKISHHFLGYFYDSITNFLLYGSIFTVLAIVTTANGDDIAIDTRDGEDLKLECRFSPDYSSKEFLYYWARYSTTNRFENVAINQNSLSATYK